NFPGLADGPFSGTSSGDIKSVAIGRADGLIAVVGNSDDANGDFLAFFHPDGSLIFYRPVSQGLSDVKLQRGELIVGGTSASGSSFYLAKYASDGALEPAFGNGGSISAPAANLGGVTHLALAPDYRVVAAG